MFHSLRIFFRKGIEPIDSAIIGQPLVAFDHSLMADPSSQVSILRSTFRALSVYLSASGEPISV